jgi:hypothetical protein
MPAKKPRSLNTRAETKEAKAARAAGESAAEPITKLVLTPPSALKNHIHAGKVWRRLIGLYNETEGTIVTAFDSDLLIKYCLAEEELLELQQIRALIKKTCATHLDLLKKFKPNKEDLRDYFNALAQANALLQRFQGMDARMDGKRKYVLSLSQSLYLTPRSRAGVAPTEKPVEQPKSAMAELLED